MSDRGDRAELRRILVALDASAQSLAALEAVLILAAGTRAEILGLFVEDIRLLDLGRSPAARALSYPAGAERSLDSRTQERDMRTMAERARQALSAAAGRLGVPWTFRLARGEVAPEILAAARDADLVSLGRASARFAGATHLGSTARSVLSRAPGAVFLAGAAGRGRTVLLAADDPARSSRALTLAARIATTLAGRLVVLLSASGRTDVDRFREEISNRLPGLDLGVSFRRIAPEDGRSLTRAVALEDAAALVLPAGLKSIEENDLVRLVRGVSCSVLLVRRSVSE